MRTRPLTSALLGAAALTLTLVALPATASALDFGFGVGISLKGGVQLGGVDEPEKEELNGNPAPENLYPGFFGVGYGIGGFLEGRVFDLVGIELGFTYEESSGEGEINDRPITLTSEDLIVSLHARILTPGMVKFMFGIGPEFIVPLGAGASQDSAILSPRYEAVERDLTTALGVAIGAEIDAVFVRIPIELRFRYMPLSDDYEDRAVAFGPTTTLKTNWNYQGLVVVGLQYYLDVWSLL